MGTDDGWCIDVRYKTDVVNQFSTMCFRAQDEGSIISGSRYRRKASRGPLHLVYGVNVKQELIIALNLL